MSSSRPAPPDTDETKRLATSVADNCHASLVASSMSVGGHRGLTAAQNYRIISKLQFIHLLIRQQTLSLPLCDVLQCNRRHSYCHSDALEGLAGLCGTLLNKPHAPAMRSSCTLVIVYPISLVWLKTIGLETEISRTRPLGLSRNLLYMGHLSRTR